MKLVSTHEQEIDILFKDKTLHERYIFLERAENSFNEFWNAYHKRNSGINRALAYEYYLAGYIKAAHIRKQLF